MTQLRVSSSVVIDRPVPEVFEFVSPPEHQQIWWSAVHEVDAQGGRGPGTAVRQVLKILGRRMTFVGAVVRYEENALTETRGSKHTDFAFRHRFEPVDSETRVTFEAEIETQGVWKAGTDTARRILQGEVDLSLSHLKDLLEAHEDLHSGLDELPAHRHT